MTDLDTLRPEVREAINRTEMTVERFDTIVPVHRDDYDIIRAELLRLTDENARLRERVSDTERFRDVHIRAAGIFRKRAEKAEAELLRLADDCARLVDCINAQPPTRRSLIDRAERAEAELAALKARIAEAPTAQLIDQGRAVQQWYVRATDGSLLALPPALSGKRVRLVVEE
jgi:chromosome segregation ATPase